MNLVNEDNDAEKLEKVNDINYDKLPIWKKSHSCPKEGRMVKAVSYNELNQQFRASKNFLNWESAGDGKQNNCTTNYNLPEKRMNSLDGDKKIG